jgi:hypothetical protein
VRGDPCIDCNRIAAGIQKQVRELLPVQDDNCYLETPPLPEAPASVNVRLQIDGRDCQLTLRDTNEARLLQRLQAVLAQYPAPQPTPQAPPQGPGQEWCSKHQTAMKRHENAKGVWYSHYVDGAHCIGK